MNITQTQRELRRLNKILAGYKMNPSARSKRKKSTAKINKLKRDIAKLQTALQKEKKKASKKKPIKKKAVGRPSKKKPQSKPQTLADDTQVLYEYLKSIDEYDEFLEWYYDHPELQGQALKNIVKKYLKTIEAVPEFVADVITRRPVKKRAAKRKKKKPVTRKDDITLYMRDVADEFDDLLDWDVELAGKTW